jgi:hypothetical protein
VWKILRSAGINPTRDRTGPTWTEFIGSQAAGLAMILLQVRTNFDLSQES